MILAVVLILGLSAASYARKLVAEGKTFTAMGDYKIELADETVPLKGNDCKAFVITYQNSPMEVTVVICKDRDCKRYVVLSDKLSVQYVCNENYFGVEKLDKVFEKEGYTTSDQTLNRTEYFHQKVIGPGKRGELENTQLIAAYFPMLIDTASDAVALK